MRLLDLGRYQAGPRCALMFARLGAEVIKVEALAGDESRGNPPFVRGQSAYWVQYNSGKKSLAVDLRTDGGKDVLRDLVKVSDVFLQNFRPGTINDMGFGYEALKKLNQRIVMVNVSAFGQYGPYRDRLDFDPIGQAIGGMMSLTGFPDGPPVRTFFPLIDRITALHATIGALAALHERDISGEGQAIDVSLADTGFTANEIPISAYLGSGEVQEREGNGAGTANAYQTAEGWVYVIANNNATFFRMCDVIGRPEWKQDERFTTKVARGKNAATIEAAVSSWLADKTKAEAVDMLADAGVPIAPINSVEEAAVDPHMREREVIKEVDDPIAGKIQVAGSMIKLSRTPMVVGTTPMVGQHTREVLAGTLGYSDEKIEALAENGVVGLGTQA